MGRLGYGVFTKEKIIKGTAVSVYVGDISPINLIEPTDHYVMDMKAVGDQRAITARKSGNIASFIQHLPSPEGHEHYAAEVAFENLTAVKHGNSIILVALKDIEANEMLGFNYGNEKYWDVLRMHHGIVLEYMNKEGVPHSPCNVRFTYRDVYDFLYTIASLQLKNMDPKKALMQLIRECMADIESRLDKVDYICLSKRIGGISDLSAFAMQKLLYTHIDFLRLIPEKYRLLVDHYLMQSSFTCTKKLLTEMNNYSTPIFYRYLHSQTGNSVHPALLDESMVVCGIQLPSNYYLINEAKYYVYLPLPRGVESKQMEVHAEHYHNLGMNEFRQGLFQAALKSWNQVLCCLRTKHILTGEILTTGRQYQPITEMACSAYWNMGTVYYKNLNNLVEAEYHLNLAVTIAGHLNSTEKKYQVRLDEVREKINEEAQPRLSLH